MKRIGEDVAEKLDYQPGVFTVERHVRGKWVCACCEKLVQTPVAPHIIDKGIPTTGLLAQVLVAKYLDHLPLYRQEAIFERAGLAIARSTLAQWVGECGVRLQPLVDALVADMLKAPVLHADETPVAMLKPGHGKTHRAYLWSYCKTSFNPMKAVVFDFAETRGGQHVRELLGLPGNDQNPGWKGRLVSDDFSGYKACFELGVTEAGCMAHARRKFHELWANHGSQVGEQALKLFIQLYEVERDVQHVAPDERKAIRQRKSKPIADALHQWLTQQRQKVPDGSATARAIDYSLKRWAALVRFIDDGDLPIDTDAFDNGCIRQRMHSTRTFAVSFLLSRFYLGGGLLSPSSDKPAVVLLGVGESCALLIADGLHAVVARRPRLVPTASRRTTSHQLESPHLNCSSAGRTHT